MIFIPANTGTASNRRIYFDLRAGDGLTAALSETAGQPQVSTDGAAWTNTGIGTLVSIGNGRYYADLTQATIATAGVFIQTRYKSANTVETPGDSAVVVAYNPYDAVRLGLTAMPGAAPATTGGFPVIGTGTNSVSTDGAGNINANITLWRAAQPNTLTSGRVDATIGAMQNSVVTASAIATDAITAAKIADGTIDRATFAVDTGLQTIRSNTAQAGAAGNLTLDASASSVNSFYNDCVLYLTAGTGVGQARLITAYDSTTKVATIVPNWATTPDGTTSFSISPTARIDIGQWIGVTPNALISGRVDANTQATAAGLTFNLTGTVSGSVGSVTGAVGSVTGNVGGNVVGSTGSIATGGIVAGSFAADAVNAAALATDAVNEIRDAIMPKKNTALPDIEFLMVDSTNHVTPKTGLTVAGARSIDGGAFGGVTGTITEVANGIYQFDASAADLNGTIITFRFTGTNADDTFLTIKTGG